MQEELTQKKLELEAEFEAKKKEAHADSNRVNGAEEPAAPAPAPATATEGVLALSKVGCLFDFGFARRILVGILGGLFLFCVLDYGCPDDTTPGEQRHARGPGYFSCGDAGTSCITPPGLVMCPIVARRACLHAGGNGVPARNRSCVGRGVAGAAARGGRAVAPVYHLS